MRVLCSHHVYSRNACALAQVVYWKGRAEAAQALAEAANELIIAAIGADEGGGGGSGKSKGKGAEAKPALHINVQRMVDKLRSLEGSLGPSKCRRIPTLAL